MRVIVTAKAEAQLARRRAWWRESREKAPDLFDRDLQGAIEQIRQAPESFPKFGERRGRVIRRGSMEKTRCHLYFEIRVRLGEVWVIAVAAGGQRRRPPRIVPP